MCEPPTTNDSSKKGRVTMKTQTTLQTQPVKKLTLNKESIRLLAQTQGQIPDPTADCTVWTCAVAGQ
jgi:hypothetical protein